MALDVPSHEWIYLYIYQDKSKGGKLYLHLRHQKKYQKPDYKNTDRGGQITDKKSIHCQDEVIDQQQRLGDFEGDTVIGKHHKGALLTLVDRMSHAHSVTFDNGKKFSEHKRITDAGMDTYLLILTSLFSELEMKIQMV